MNRKTKIWIVAAVLLMGIAAAFVVRGCRHQTPEAVPQTTGVVRLVDNGRDNPRSDQMLQLHASLWVTVGDDAAYVEIDSLERGRAWGRYYRIDPNAATASPCRYALQVNRRSVVVALEEGDFELGVGESEIEDLLDGARHAVRVGRDTTVDISIRSYEPMPFHQEEDLRYRKPLFAVKVTPDICYGHARGYWISMTGSEGDGYAQIVLEGLKQSRSAKDLDLTLDLYEPEDSIRRSHPFVLMLHGGAFYVGDKRDSAVYRLCRHLASLGYVAASVNYRMGFQISKSEIERTGYMAVQDAHAAMRYLLAHDTAGLINPSQLFVAGTSAGSITALNLVLMTDESRPASTYRKKNRRRFSDLGDIGASGNDCRADFHFAAIANMWGAVTDLGLLKDCHTDILSIHGDADQLVPYDQGYPFSDVSSALGRRLFGMMYGSASIHRYAQQHGIRSQLVSIPGWGHAPHLNPDRSINRENYELIERSIRQFFYRTLVPFDPAIEGAEGARVHRLNGRYGDVQWHVEGGVLVSHSDMAADVVWLEDAPVHALKAMVTHPCGLRLPAE